MVSPWKNSPIIFLLTLTYPLTILSFTAIFAGLGLVEAGSGYSSPASTVIGVFIGSSSRWVLLSTGVLLFISRFQPAGLLWVNRFSGLITQSFGVAALISAISLS